MRRARRRDGGYALVAAVAAVAAFSYIAFEVLAVNRGGLASVNGEFSRARLAAATEAGMALAVQGLSADDGRWPIDGRPRPIVFNGAQLSIAVEDEKGKAPLNDLEEEDVRQMFSAAGVSGSRLMTLVDSFEDWQDEDDARRASGAERVEYAAAGLRPRNGEMRNVEELSALNGMDRALFARLAPALTVFPGARGGFNPATASAMALAIMSGADADDDPPAVQRAPGPASLVGHPLTIRVTATDGHGGRLERSAVIELTGRPERPYWVRYLN